MGVETELSLQGEQARLKTAQALKDRITKSIVDNWSILHSADHKELTEENVRSDYEFFTNPPPDSTGKKPKYFPIGGELIPSSETIEEFSLAAGRATTKGTSTNIPFLENIPFVGQFGGVIGQLLGMLMTAFSALIDWASNGFKGSFTESYAKITANNISKEFEKEMDGMGAEHRAFIDKNNVVEEGKKHITDGVKSTAGLVAEAPAFDLASYIKEHPAMVKPMDLSGITNPTEAVQAAIKATEEQKPFAEKIAALPNDQRQQLETMKSMLLKNGEKLAEKIKSGDKHAPRSGREFAKHTIEHTIEDYNKTVDDKKKINLASSQDAGTLVFIASLETNLQAAYEPIAKWAGKAVSPVQEKQETEALRYENAQRTMEQIRRGIATETIPGVINGVKEATAIKVAPVMYIPGGLWSAAKTVNTYKKTNYTEDDHKKVSAKPLNNQEQAAVNTLYNHAAGKGRTLNEAQLDLAAEATAKAIESVITSSNEVLTADQMARRVELAINQNLRVATNEQGRTIDQLGTPVSTINESNKTKTQSADILGDIAHAAAEHIRNDPATYSRLRAAQEQSIESMKVLAQGHTYTTPLSPKDLEKLNAGQHVTPTPGFGKTAGSNGISRGGSPTRQPSGPGPVAPIGG